MGLGTSDFAVKPANGEELRDPRVPRANKIQRELEQHDLPTRSQTVVRIGYG